MTYQITTQRDLRRAFWAENTRLDKRRIKHGDDLIYVCDTRMAWCDYVEHMCRSGAISEELAGMATL